MNYICYCTFLVKVKDVLINNYVLYMGSPLPAASIIPLSERIEGPPVPAGVPLPDARVISPKERIEGTPVASGPLPEVYKEMDTLLTERIEGRPPSDHPSHLQ